MVSDRLGLTIRREISASYFSRTTVECVPSIENGNCSFPSLYTNSLESDCEPKSDASTLVVSPVDVNVAPSDAEAGSEPFQYSADVSSSVKSISIVLFEIWAVMDGESLF